jgi:hypothetical protein
MLIWQEGESKVEDSFSSVMFKTVDNLVKDSLSTFLDVTFVVLGENMGVDFDDGLFEPRRTFVLNIMRFDCTKKIDPKAQRITLARDVKYFDTFSIGLADQGSTNSQISVIFGFTDKGNVIVKAY